MPSATTDPPAGAPPEGALARRGQLALALQETLTAIVRLRANRQAASDAESFRRQLRHVMGLGEQQASRLGYADEDVRLGLFAVVAFLDESVLSSANPMFADWPRRPMQEELFGGHLGGELFFQQLQYLLARPDSEDLADVLEVYQLCMLLGFHGRYSASDTGEMRALIERVGERIRRIRGGDAPLSPSWTPSADDLPAVRGDPWARRLAIGAIALVVIVGVLYVAYTFSLRSGMAELLTLAPSIAG